MNLKISRKIVIAMSVIAATACHSSQQAAQEAAKPAKNIPVELPSFEQQAANVPPALPVIPVENRMMFPDNSFLLPEEEENELYSFVAENIEIRDALQIFSRAYGLNIVSDSDVNGIVTVEFNDLSLKQAMSAMLSSLGLHWEKKENLIEVKRWHTRTFTIDYLRLIRSGQGTSSANVSSSVASGSSGGQSGGSGGGGGGGQNSEDGTFELKQSDSVEFWDELTEQLVSMVSEDGRIAINRMSGTIQITDSVNRVKQMENYLGNISRAIHRQVEIDVRIVEVELNEDYSLGVDWSLISNGSANQTQGTAGINNIINQPLGGFGALLPSVSLNIFESERRINFDALISALNEQGEVSVVSKPKIRTMNNQPAMIKVGTDRTFFIRTVTTDTSTAGSTSLIEDTPLVVTEGIVMALTPQISSSGWIMMDISPVISRVTSVERVVDNNGNTTSSSPNLDIRQTSSLVRMENGNTVVIGGLIQTTDTDTNREVPGLAKVPLIGNLFKGDYEVSRRKELLIFLTANLVDSTPSEFVYESN